MMITKNTNPRSILTDAYIRTIKLIKISIRLSLALRPPPKMIRFNNGPSSSSSYLVRRASRKLTCSFNKSIRWLSGIVTSLLNILGFIMASNTRFRKYFISYYKNNKFFSLLYLYAFSGKRNPSIRKCKGFHLTVIIQTDEILCKFLVEIVSKSCTIIL